MVIAVVAAVAVGVALGLQTWYIIQVSDHVTQIQSTVCALHPAPRPCP